MISFSSTSTTSGASLTSISSTLAIIAIFSGPLLVIWWWSYCRCKYWALTDTIVLGGCSFSADLGEPGLCAPPYRVVVIVLVLLRLLFCLVRRSEGL